MRIEKAEICKKKNFFKPLFDRFLIIMHPDNCCHSESGVFYFQRYSYRM